MRMCLDFRAEGGMKYAVQAWMAVRSVLCDVVLLAGSGSDSTTTRGGGRLATRAVRDLAIALVATGLAACSANATEREGTSALRDGGASDADVRTIDLEASCTPTEGGASPLDASACANLPALCPAQARDPSCGTSDQCYSDGIAAACVVGQTYACVVPPPLVPDPGYADAQTVPPAACVVGRTFCYRNQSEHFGGEVSCPDVPDACTNNPNCACLCSSLAYGCSTECSCVESGGFATVTCQQI